MNDCQLSLQRDTYDTSLLVFIRSQYTIIGGWPIDPSFRWLNWYIENGYCITAEDATLSIVGVMLVRPTDRPELMHEWYRYYHHKKGTVCWVDIFCDPGLQNLKGMWDLARESIGPKEYVAFHRDIRYDKVHLIKESRFYAKVIRRRFFHTSNTSGTTRTTDSSGCSGGNSGQ